MTGTFNDWKETSTPLSKEEGGYWSANVAKAKVEDEYRFLIHPPADWKMPVLSRIDPYAKKVTNSTGNGAIYDPKAFQRPPGGTHVPTTAEAKSASIYATTL